MPSSGDRIVADFGEIENFIADQGTYRGRIEDVDSGLQTQSRGALDLIAGGMGEEEHEGTMQGVHTQFDGAGQSVSQMESDTQTAYDSYYDHGMAAKNALLRGSGG